MHLEARIHTSELRKCKKDLDNQLNKLKSKMMRIANRLMEPPTDEQRYQVKPLELIVANERRMMAEILDEYEEVKTTIRDLQSRIAKVEIQIVNGENLHKTLHNTVLELKGCKSIEDLEGGEDTS